MFQCVAADDLIESPTDLLDRFIGFDSKFTRVLPGMRIHFDAGPPLGVQHLQEKSAAAPEIQDIIACGDIGLPQMLVVQGLGDAVFALPGKVFAALIAEIMADDSIAGRLITGTHCNPGSGRRITGVMISCSI